MFKNLVILPVIALIIALAGCETSNNNAAIDAAIAEMKAQEAEQEANRSSK